MEYFTKAKSSNQKYNTTFCDIGRKYRNVRLQWIKVLCIYRYTINIDSIMI